MRFTRGHDVIVRHVLLNHEVHGADVVSRKSPVAFRLQTSQKQLRLQAFLNSCNIRCDFPCDEFKSTARRFVIEQDARATEHIIGFAVVAGEIETVYLRDSIRRPRAKSCGLNL